MPETPLPGLRFVVALPSEAAPLIAHWKLLAHEKCDATTFRIYHCSERRHWLIVSGVGHRAATAATAYLAGVSDSRRYHAWLNVGIAGHGTAEWGSAFLAHKIRDTAFDQNAYPFLIETNLPTSELHTVTRPAAEIPNDILIDMEAAAFYHAALSLSMAELVQCVKVVSDHGAEQPLSKQFVKRLIQDRIEAIESVAQSLVTMSEKFAERWADPPAFAAYLKRWRFTATQRHQLRTLLVRLRALNLEPHVENASSASEILNRLSKQVDEEPLILHASHD